MATALVALSFRLFATPSVYATVLPLPAFTQSGVMKSHAPDADAPHLTMLLGELVTIRLMVFPLRPSPATTPLGNEVITGSEPPPVKVSVPVHVASGYV